ncbi:MAG: UDP-N-acetylmuramate--alanine ligase [Solirubrobacteraceae bacterium]|jgi:UDP-N-acetylmuramate--alanine ligase|nr:UDP-N-acetylmuramate--alanine ligase [Solirubrobacteraceae bacterium]
MTGAPWSGRRLHILGVGGAGMSAYARAAHALGATVTGSDRAESPFARGLAEDGVLRASIGHAAANLPAGADVEVFCSSAIAPENVERRAAQERGLRVRGRAELLGELTRLRRTIAVAGAHGKTTTASMVTTALRGCGLDPGYLIGGTLRETGRNGAWGSGDWLVVEADESDRSMLSLTVEIAVLTSVELDHHASFGSRLELDRVYRRFLAGAPAAVIWDRPELLALREGPVSAYDVPAPVLVDGGSRFEAHGVAVSLRVPGAHNALNAAGALEVCRLVGADLGAAAAALGAFAGVARRFERLGRTPTGASVYDDYAHHPTEVAATLAAARTLPHRRLVAVFQPHLYSRTRELAREFGEALAGADVVVVLDVYPARERAVDFPGVSGRMIAAASADAAGGRPVYWLPGPGEAEQVLGGLLGADDLCLVVGAGDVDELGRRLIG